MGYSIVAVLDVTECDGEYRTVVVMCGTVPDSHSECGTEPDSHSECGTEPDNDSECGTVLDSASERGMDAMTLYTISYHFNHYCRAVACRPMCIIPQVGMIGYHYIYQPEIINCRLGISLFVG